MAPRRRLVLLVALAAALVAVVVAVLALRGPSRPSAPAVDQAAAGTVLLVPGYGGGTGGLERMAGALRAAGRDAVVVPAAGDGTGDLAASAALVGAAAQRALDAGAPSVDVVGYSAGGVVARVWLAGSGAGVAVRRVVTLGAPHQGTDLARFAATSAPDRCPLACQQLVPGSDLLDGLPATPGGAAGGAGGASAWTSAWSATDEVVVPPETASALPGALAVPLQQVCPGAQVSHGQLVTDPLPVGLVDALLDGPLLTAAPASSSCDALRARGAALLGG